jgi:hypothetical protein
MGENKKGDQWFNKQKMSEAVGDTNTCHGIQNHALQGHLGVEEMDPDILLVGVPVEDKESEAVGESDGVPVSGRVAEPVGETEAVKLGLSVKDFEKETDGPEASS